MLLALHMGRSLKYQSFQACRQPVPPAVKVIAIYTFLVQNHIPDWGSLVIIWLGNCNYMTG